MKSRTEPKRFPCSEAMYFKGFVEPIIDTFFAKIRMAGRHPSALTTASVSRPNRSPLLPSQWA